MSIQLAEVAQRIKTLREILEISEVEMARNTDVSVDEYRQYELGEKDFSFTFIYKCAKHLDVDPTDLISGVSPTLTSYNLTRKGDGLPIARRKGFEYINMAPLFKKKVAEPFYVKMPYSESEQDKPIKLSTHEGQEFDIVISGSIKIQIGEHIEVLEAGDSIYYNSSSPHGMIAVDGECAEIYAIVLQSNIDDKQNVPENDFEQVVKSRLERKANETVIDSFINTSVDENGVLKDISFKNSDSFNFAFDIVDVLAQKYPNKTAMLHITDDFEERRFSFDDMAKYSSMTANYFASLGIKKGDRVMLVLKRHYQFWFSIIALHKLAAIAVPATHLLVSHDLEYRFNAAGVKAVVCTSDGDVANQVDLAMASSPTLETKIIVGGSKDGWNNFNEEMPKYSNEFARTSETACGNDPMLMFFTSGTTGYPKIAMHDYKYPLGHYITAKYWHNVNPDGLHLTIADTGWGKALWGKLYGQWMCEAGLFTCDFNRFDANIILPMFKKYGITTFCAPPTMYRLFIKEDLSKYDLSTIEYSTTAGEALNPEVFEQWKKATGLTLMEGFGQTETTLSVFNPVGTTPKVGAMGRPSPMYDVDIISADGKSVPVGEVGEIVIRTDKEVPFGLFMEYYNDDAKTKEAWSDGIYHTGDTAWRDEDGYLWYVGRTDDVIKSSGYRIGPFEIESVIMELPYILECAATGAPDPIRGQVVKATIVLTKGTVGTDELKKEIQKYVKTHTAPYKYPRIVEFVDELPKTISGKIRRVELRNQ
ncbi:MAG: cupin domain-containing protein [Clostridia bacterium]|nr:cupin domain-containing protein [Clostridia bacterium]